MCVYVRVRVNEHYISSNNRMSTDSEVDTNEKLRIMVCVIYPRSYVAACTYVYILASWLATLQMFNLHLHFTILCPLLITLLQAAQLTACTHVLVALENLQE